MEAYHRTAKVREISRKTTIDVTEDRKTMEALAFRIYFVSDKTKLLLFLRNL